MRAGPSVGGVVTTGIYCRDGCPGRPKRRNVVEFPAPVAAEAAGFRACYRCRPDRLPPTVTLNGVPPVVAQALLIISEGALDEGGEDDLGRRLSISGRQLRRLFLEHIGATPDLVARSRRAHFARRLLDETDLSIARIAFAAGFSSVRQMNRVMLETFRAPPSELRSRRRRADRLVADGGLLLRVPYRPPFDFTSMLDFLRIRAIPGVESVNENSYRRTITTCGHPGVIEVRDACDGRHLLLTAHLPTFDSIIDDVARVRHLFGLDQPRPLTLQPLIGEPSMAPKVAARPGLRVPGAWDRFEVATRIIVGQGISVKAASTIAGRLVESLGVAVPGLVVLGLTHTFPSSQRIAEARLPMLRSIGLTNGRAEAIRSLARAYAVGDLPLDASVSLPAMLDRLMALPGVGPWTANFIALRAAGHLDAFPAEDLGLRRAIAREDSRLAPVREIAALAEHWRPFRAVAAVYLWQSLQGSRSRR